MSSNQTAAEQEKKQSEMETEKMWGTQVQYGTTMVQVSLAIRELIRGWLWERDKLCNVCVV